MKLFNADNHFKIMIDEEADEPKLELKPISAKMPPEMIDAIDELIRQEQYATRSEVIRIAVRDLIKQYEGTY